MRHQKGARMAHGPSQSLKYEYELYVEREIENYKESIPRLAILAIGDEAVRVIAAKAQFELHDVVLCEEVNKIIFKRLALLSYAAWKKRRMKEIAELKRLVRAVHPMSGDSRVLVAGGQVETPALYLAANGCDVTALSEPDHVQRVLDAAEQAGLGERVHASASALCSFTPDAPLTAVIYTPAAFAGLSAAERARVIQVLQSATADGGVHLVQTIAAGKRTAVSLEELRRRYRDWDVTVDEAAPNSFLARKSGAAESFM